MKNCTVCGELKSLDDFFNRRASEDGKAYRCKDCDNKAVNAHRALHRERYLVRQQKANRKAKYGLSDEEYVKLLVQQDNRCAICKKKTDLVVDHCHNSNIVRGLLCKPCNQGLGLFYDNKESLRRAIDYLDSEIH